MLSGILACAAGTPAPTTSQLCVPGDQKACACPGQDDGVQVCADDGSRYGTCSCPTGAGGNPGTTGVGGMTTVGGSGGAPGMGGHGTGGSTDAASPVVDAADASSVVDAPAGTGGAGATDAGGTGGAPAVDGGVIDVPVVVDGAGTPDASSVVDAGPGVDAGADAPLAGVTITPGPTGIVLGTSNVLGVQGSWYAYSDGMGADGSTATGICEAGGGHLAAACSQVTTPAVGSFPNVGGKMCTSGKAAVVIAGVNSLPDYAHITGAGIGLDLNNSLGAVPVRSPFNATAKSVTGVAFDLDIVALPSLRVEFPTPTDAPSVGAAYWGATAAFLASPVVAGTNVIRWADVRVPSALAPQVDQSMIESILFHVPTNVTAAGPYSFCVSNLRLLTN